ncbi:ImmA/IrrE family metallo-endopeptidase [Bradyrhizobium brasilense]|uniref:ImmA/IrrE family metallo-endopeptidase n=1 Tax=Bradyrhizobium brasilense TaxID=1419277 RepID=A0ABY8JJK8_9BRAD|nr:ImmA/IrrE family metallo-endopeptidase [Bradyrhizobium brasilense]WFU65810.1 ImmA/IrrE family metallo-endopeptidase [Bradyrhizobium brasilense]
MKADTERARSAAQAIIRDFAVKSPPVPIERIIKSKNIVLQYAPLEEELSGMAYIKDGVGIIGVNALHHPNRQRFSAAHELAHHELHAKEIRKTVHVDREFRVLLRDDVSSQGVNPLEIEANAFASELLMPRELLMTALGDGGLDLDDEAGIDALARKFRVSPAAMRYRLTNRL